MRQLLVGACAMALLSLPSLADERSNSDVDWNIPLTGDAFAALSAQDAARRLLGPSGEFAASMVLGPPPSGFTYGPQQLSHARFYSRPTALFGGLCNHKEISVRLVPEDGSFPGQATALTPMKVTNVSAREKFLIVRELADNKVTVEKDLALEQACSDVSVQSQPFFAADSPMDAWQGSYLVTLALQAGRSSSQSVKIECKASECNSLGKEFLLLSTKSLLTERRRLFRRHSKCANRVRLGRLCARSAGRRKATPR
jgi:hypothetical protein